MTIIRQLKIKLILFQRDFFTRRRRVFNNISLITRNRLNYLPINDVLEILEYNNLRGNKSSFTVTDGSELVTISRKGSVGRREGVHFRIDPLITIKKLQFISLRSINRLFNVDLTLNIRTKSVSIQQPGRFFTTLRGDTLKILAILLNTSVRRLLSVNKDLKEPIPPGIKLTIPTIDFDAGVRTLSNAKSPKNVKINFHIEHGPIVALGRKLRGTPYQFGAGPFPRSRRFDCSSYTRYIFGRNGESLPRTSRAQARVGIFRRQRDIEPGDLIFFRRDRYSDNRIGHVGVDIGNGRMLNTYASPRGVTITRWRSPFWLRRYVTAKELL